LADIFYESMAKVEALDGRGRKDQPQSSTSDIRVTQLKNHFSNLVSKMEVYDPQGKRAHSITANHRK
jgi:hypothetical protein